MPQMGTSSFYLCSKINEKASIMTAKQSKKQELDLLQAVEKIVELAKDSQLSKDFFRKAGKYIKYLSEALDLTKEQSVMMSLFIDNSEEPNKLLLVSSVDNNIYFVKLPLKWVENEDIEKYEQVEIKIRSDLNAMMKIQDFLAKDEDYNSDEDSLNGWDYFANDAKEEQDKLKNKK